MKSDGVCGRERDGARYEVDGGAKWLASRGDRSGSSFGATEASARCCDCVADGAIGARGVMESWWMLVWERRERRGAEDVGVCMIERLGYG